MQPTGPVISLLDDERSDLLAEMQNALSSNTNSQSSDIFNVPSDADETRLVEVSKEINTQPQKMNL